MAAVARAARRRRRIAPLQQRGGMDARRPVGKRRRFTIERRHARLIGVALRAGLRDVERRHGRPRIAYTTDPMRPVAIDARRHTRLSRGHPLAVRARQVLRVLIDTDLRVEPFHVRRVAVAFRAQRRNRRTGDRRVRPRRPLMTGRARQLGGRMHVITNGLLGGLFVRLCKERRRGHQDNRRAPCRDSTHGVGPPDARNAMKVMSAI